MNARADDKESRLLVVQTWESFLWYHLDRTINVLTSTISNPVLSANHGSLTLAFHTDRLIGISSPLLRQTIEILGTHSLASPGGKSRTVGHSDCNFPQSASRRRRDCHLHRRLSCGKVISRRTDPPRPRLFIAFFALLSFVAHLPILHRMDFSNAS
jgi:hypothetical protein